MSPPEQMTINSINDYLTAMTKVVFQSGMSAAVVEAKWNGFLEAFHGFDCEAVADLTPDDVDRLCQDSRIIRNRRKIEATVHNANRLLELEAAGGFGEWLGGHPDEAGQEKAIRSQFKFLGPSGIHQFLWMVGATDVACDE